MRHVPQEPVLLLLEIMQPRTQPLETLPEIAQVLRPVDLDPVPEIGGAHPADRLIELPDGTRDQHGEENRQRERDGGGGEREVQPLLPSLRRNLLQPLDGAFGQPVRGGEHRPRAVGEARVAFRELSLCFRRPLRHRQQSPQPVLVVGQRREHRQRLGIEGQQRELRGRAPEFLADAIVVVEQRAVLENQMLPHDALERSRLLEQLPAGASGLGRLLHCFPALRLQPIERKDQLAQRVQQRQADQKEAEQDEFEERTGVIHVSRRYNLGQL